MADPGVVSEHSVGLPSTDAGGVPVDGACVVGLTKVGAPGGATSEAGVSIRSNLGDLTAFVPVTARPNCVGYGPLAGVSRNRDLLRHHPVRAGNSGG